MIHNDTYLWNFYVSIKVLYDQEVLTWFLCCCPLCQVTVDVAWSPAHIDSRYYDYRGLALASDFLFVMSYDERSQIFGACVAAANSGFYTTLSGMEQNFHNYCQPIWRVIWIKG